MISSRAFSPVKIEKIALSLLAFAALTTFVLLIEGRYILKLIPLKVQGLNQIGVIKTLKGNAFRKLKNDSLHLPLSVNDMVYEDDLVTTDDSSTLEVLLLDKKNSGNTLLQEPNTILRLSHDRGSLLIQLQTGSVTTQFTDDTLVKVQSGTLTKEIQIRKGTYLIKNSSLGIQITAFDSNIAVKKSSNTTEESRKVYKAEVENDDKKNTVHKNDESENIDISKFRMPMRLPYPEDNQVFLLADQSIKIIVLVAKKACEGICHLQVSCGKDILYAKELSSGSVPRYGLEVPNSNHCSEITWNFSDEKENFEKHFSVENYTDAIFQKYINLGQPIEML